MWVTAKQLPLVIPRFLSRDVNIGMWREEKAAVVEE